jgi:hypothetical protein
MGVLRVLACERLPADAVSLPAKPSCCEAAVVEIQKRSGAVTFDQGTDRTHKKNGLLALNDGFASLAGGRSQEGRWQEGTAGQKRIRNEQEEWECSGFWPATAFLLTQSAFLRSPPAAKQPS